VSLYCGYCYLSATQTGGLPEGDVSCRTCARSDYLRCASCEHPVPAGLDSCPRCPPVELEPVKPTSRFVGEMMPLLPQLERGSLTIPVMPKVVERYSAGRFGISAEVTIPAGDVERMNALGAMVTALHHLAGQLNGFTLLTDHTRKLIRDMRILATDAQEEIEMRRGPT
jgi:hypothetical protein